MCGLILSCEESNINQMDHYANGKQILNCREAAQTHDLPLNQLSYHVRRTKERGKECKIFFTECASTKSNTKVIKKRKNPNNIGCA